jgi:Xaa-Pro dipeptidase
MQTKFTLTDSKHQLVEPLPFSNKEYSRRLSGLHASMAKEGIDTFISFTPENMYYMTGNDTPGYYFYQACVIRRGEMPINVLRRIEATNTLLRSWNQRVVIYGDRDDPVAATLWLLNEMGLSGKRIGVEADSFFVTPRRYAALVAGVESAGGFSVEAQLVEPLRLIKSEEELRYTREAAKVAEEGMTAAIEASAVGHTEDYVAARVLARMTSCGGEYAGLPPFITSGPRSSLCHASWGGRALRFGDALAYELPGVRNRYAAVLFRCGTVGPAPKDIARLGDAAIQSLEDVIALIKPGATSHDVHSASRRNFEKYGYGDLHGHRTGYSVGVNYPPDWGEGHILSLWDGDERQLQAGMVFHLVPGIFLPGRCLINISETVLVTETGCEVITDFKRDLFVVNAGGR